jgi:UDP-glucose 4-epimerase
VTGGTGFIGGHLVGRLASEGQAVVVLDNFSNSKSGALTSFGDRNVKLLKGDIRNTAIVDNALSGVDTVIHLAAIVDHEACLRNPELANDVNAAATRLLLEAARRHGVDSFVYASSAAVYGEPKQLPISEDVNPNPLSPYGFSKLQGERHCLQYLHDYGLHVACLRFFNIFGPRQTALYAGVVTEFIKKLKRGEAPLIFGDGLQSRDFVYVNDVAEAISLAADNPNAKGVYNIATGKETTINKLAGILICISNQQNLKPIHAAERPKEIKRSVADITKARSQLGFEPKTDLQSDLQELWNSHSI